MFTCYPCWQKDRVFTVMNPDAEHVSDEIFLAVHSEHDLTLLETISPNRQGSKEAKKWRTTPREFLQTFLDPNRHHVQAVIQGESGSGKSHFIKWLSLNIHTNSNQYVLTIPKAGMSLRNIVERLIKVLPVARQKKYFDQLEHIGYHTQTKQQRVESLINEIAKAIKFDSPQNTNQIQEAEEELIRELPNIFYDPHLRPYLDKTDGIIGQLVEHIFEAPNNYQRLDGRRMFQREDLPLDVRDIQNMSKEAQDILRYLAVTPDLVNLSLDIINRNLNRAIPSVLNFTGDQLIDLISDIRKSLKKEGKHLILLIEDFARLQGIDGALLQALIEAGSDSNNLCEMRWAMAITTGYYEQIPSTVQTRTDFLIDMDISTTGSEAMIDDNYIVSFAGKYLNAVRLSKNKLDEWVSIFQQSIMDQISPPNACDSCNYRDFCHNAFGQIHGIGLYPFSKEAILNMARRRDRHLDTRFNPRILIKHVLAEVLGNYRHELETSQFPSDQLLQVMGGSKFPPFMEDQLNRSNPKDFLRLRTLLGLWGEEPDKYKPLPEGIYQSFGLDPIKKGTFTEKKQPENEGPKNSIDPAQTKVSPNRNIEAIQGWGRGDVMPERVASDLRELIFDAVTNYIDWDASGLEKTAFARKTDGFFRSRFISFHRQQTKPSNSIVSLPIPIHLENEDELRQSAIALEGLLLFKNNRSWNFPDGSHYLVVLSERLDIWSKNILKQFKTLLDPKGEWDPVPTVIEILAVGATMSGRPPKSKTSQEDYLNALFETWQSPETNILQSPEWKSLYRSIYQRQQILKEMIQAWASGTKGGQAGNFINPGKLLPPLKKVRRSWELTVSMPEGNLLKIDKYDKLVELNKRIINELRSISQIELARLSEIYKRIQKYLPEINAWAEVSQSLQELRQLVKKHGITCPSELIQNLDISFKEVKGQQLENHIKTMDALLQETDPLQSIPQLGRQQVETDLITIERFFIYAEKFLLEAESSVANIEASLTNEEHTLQQDQERISTSLIKLSEALVILGGSNDN